MRAILMTENGVTIKEIVHADKADGLNLVTADGYRVKVDDVTVAKAAFKMLAEKNVCDLTDSEVEIEEIESLDFEASDFDDVDFEAVDFDEDDLV